MGQFSKAPECGTQASRRTVLFYFFVQLHLNAAEIRLHQNLLVNATFTLPHSASVTLCQCHTWRHSARKVGGNASVVWHVALKYVGALIGRQ